MKMAEKFGRPIFTFVDTPGAYPGLGAEERGQAEAIARNLREMSRLRVPIITTITGEGGSGGALALAIADRVLMMENAIYSVISPEGCASIMWRDASKKPSGKIDLAAFDFSTGTLMLTEAGTKKRASLHVAAGREALGSFDRGGLEVLDASLPAFGDRLTSESHTVKRALTDPRLFSGVGNAYSDEILHRARMSPVKLTRRLTDDEIRALYEATRATLIEWTERLRAETGAAFPEKVTAFRAEMAVHGRYGQPCPDCGSPVQRIRYADNETNYCPTCQTDGKLLADRGLSRLLKEDWPRSLDEL